MNNPVGALTSFDQILNTPSEKESENYEVYKYALPAFGIAAAAFTVYNARNLYWKCCQIKDHAAQAATVLYRSYLNFTHHLIIANRQTVWDDFLQQYEKYLKEKPSGSKALDELRQTVDIVKPAAQAAISKIFSDFCPKGQILELGSNLPKKGESYLASLLSQQDQKRLIYSDKSPTSKRSLQVDATLMEKQLKKSSREHIVALCVFDLIARRDLDKAVAGLHHTLKSRGKVIILSDLPFDPKALQQKYNDKFVFPYTSEHSFGIKALDIAEVKKATRQLSQPFNDFINTVLNYSPKDRFHCLYILCAKDPLFAKLLCEFCPPESYETADNTVSFTTDLEAAFKNHGGFQILENGYREMFAETRGKLENGSSAANDVSLDLRRISPLRFRWDFKLPQDTVRFKSTFYVFVAEKN